jgi:hypothetical protein
VLHAPTSFRTTNHPLLTSPFLRAQDAQSSSEKHAGTAPRASADESGTYTDPITGQQVHVRGVSTAAGVGIAAGTPVPPGIADRDREIIERELYEKGLPEDKVSIPVSGYLYFPIPKPTKDAKYRLIYSPKDQPLILTLP